MDKELKAYFYTRAEKATDMYCSLPYAGLSGDEWELVRDVLSVMFAVGIVEVGENL